MLRLDSLRKTYGTIAAVDGLSLTVEPGEVFGLLGPNGAGKSTTVNMAVGLVTPDSGAVNIGGQGPPTDPRVRRLIGVAPQALALYDDLTGAENVDFFGRLFGLSGRDLAARRDGVLARVGLSDRAGDRARTYSGGMKRRLNLAAAMVHGPRLLLLDEPTAGVDPQSRSAILEMVRALKASGCTVVYTTHYMEEAQRVCDRVAIIDHGRLLALDTVDNLISAHGGQSVVTTVRAGEERRVLTDNPLTEITSLLAAGPVDALRIERPDLEAVFLAMTGRSLRDS